MPRLRCLAALASILALSGCMKVDAQMSINENDTVSGIIVMAVDRRLAPLTGKSEEQLISTVTVAPQSIAPGTVAEPYADEDFIGRRYVFAGVPLSQFHGTDQVSMTLAHEGRSYLLNGVADLRTVNLADPAVQRFADLFAFTVSVTFPGTVVETNGVLVGRTVTWSPKAGRSLPMHARAQTPALTWWPWALGGGVFLLVVAMVIGAVAFSRRRPAAPPEPALVETRHDML